MKILPGQSRGIVVLLNDGKTFEMMPLQVFRFSGGGFCIRLGNNALYFDKEGAFDGEEAHLTAERSQEEIKLYVEALEVSSRNGGQPPDDFYFSAGSPGREAEERSRAQAPPTKPGKPYGVDVGGRPKRNRLH